MSIPDTLRSELLRRLFDDVQRAPRIVDAHVSGLLVLLGGDVARVDAVLDFCARQAHRVTIHAYTAERWFARVRAGDPRRRTDHVCLGAGRYCSCQEGCLRDGRPTLCHHSLGASLLHAMGDAIRGDTRGARPAWVKYATEAEYEAALQHAVMAR
ncbi:hypothetical protein CDCA_CDCA19G4685 [Cyanidium caldarium]|uniref:SWIM-type domain-containing protein n=1 Tax=Cyanidium caldarium TaxID=2771 RepID=A0AAV9J2Q7_CYACA|nr:hypothetical protein CDCA_CDCA19G4685 [Cyanidium caldarium]